MRQLALVLGLLGLFLTSSFPFNSYAKDLTNRLGIGYSDQFSVDLPSIAMKYHTSPDMSFGTQLGVQTESNNSKLGFAIKINKVIFPEDNMNFYMGVGAGLLSSKIAGVNNSGVELTAYCGSEFFLPGLDSLGLSFEAGLGITSLSNGVNFRTLADHPLRAGMIFYF
ncbi:MAG: organic solvent tolerance protein [Bdellovibrionales bacterium]